MDNLFNNIYRNKKVLITGHTGFKGSWLTMWLLNLGADITGYALKAATNPSLFEVLGLKDKINHIEADIRDSEYLEKVVKNCKPDIIFHLAAQPLVRYSYKNPRETYETNIMGTVNLLDAIRKNQSAKVVVNITSDKCYDNKETLKAYNEDAPMGGSDPYSSSKGAAELVISAYKKSFFNPEQYGLTHNTAMASVRAGNVIGGGDWSDDRLIPDCIKAFTQNNPVILRNPQSIRPWQHVLEPLSGYLWIGALMWEDGKAYCEGWNFGPDDRNILTVEEVVKNVIKLFDSGSYEIDSDFNPHEAKLLTLDISKATGRLNWKPVYSNADSIKETVEWYKNFYDNRVNIRDFTLNQINSYIKKAQESNIDWSLVKQWQN